MVRLIVFPYWLTRCTLDQELRWRTPSGGDFCTSTSWKRTPESLLKSTSAWGLINGKSALYRTMAWQRLWDKPLPESNMTDDLVKGCATRPQWVKPSVQGIRQSGRHTQSEAVRQVQAAVGCVRRMPWLGVGVLNQYADSFIFSVIFHNYSAFSNPISCSYSPDVAAADACRFIAVKCISWSAHISQWVCLLNVIL